MGTGELWGAVFPPLPGLTACAYSQSPRHLPVPSLSCFQLSLFYLLFGRRQPAKPGQKKQRRRRLVKKDRKLLVLKVKRLKDTYDGGGRDGIASCPRPTLRKAAAKPWDLPVFSCKACYSLCDRGSEKRPRPTALGALGAEQERQDTMGPPHVEQIAFKQQGKGKKNIIIIIN